MSTLKRRRNNDQRSDMRYSKEFKCQQKMNKWDMEDKCEYYCIAGVNGLGIFTSKDLANNSSRYVMQPRFRIFQNIEDAMEWTVSEYNSIQKNNPNGVFWPKDSDVPTDWFYRSGRIREMFPFC